VVASLIRLFELPVVHNCVCVCVCEMMMLMMMMMRGRRRAMERGVRRRQWQREQSGASDTNAMAIENSSN
jgi:hypothetical protein